MVNKISDLELKYVAHASYIFDLYNDVILLHNINYTYQLWIKNIKKFISFKNYWNLETSYINNL